MRIHESLEKVLAAQETVVDMFYLEFLDRHPEIRNYFRGIDMKRQAIQLSMTLMLVVHHYNHRYGTTTTYLHQLGQTHQQRRNVPAHLYPVFRECLLETLERFHGLEWDEELAGEWGQAVDLAAGTMLEGYDAESAEEEED